MQENQISKSKQGSDDHVSATISKNLCKLIINSCYGKTLQTDEKYNNSKIVKNQKQYMNAIEKQFLLDFNILAPAVDKNDQGLVELKLRKQNCEIRCPKYLGAYILGYSKMLMLDFVYNCLWTVYSKEELEIYYTDTDSIYLAIKNPKIDCWEVFMARFSPEMQDRYFPKSSTDITPGKMKMEKIVQSLIC